MLLAEIQERDKTEHARSQAKHGPWSELSHHEQSEAIRDEYAEWYAAFIEGDVGSMHGEINELIHLRNVAARRIMYLTGERHA